MKYRQIDQQQLRRRLLKGMCRCAEKIDLYYIYGPKFRNLHFIEGFVPENFKPGVADKFLFNKIIDEVISNITSELENDEFIHDEEDLMGAEIMIKYYYPQYGSYKKITKDGIRRYLEFRSKK